MRRFISILIIVLCAFQSVSAQQSILESDSIKLLKKVRVVALPIIFFTPETSFGLGGGGQIFFPRATNVYNARPSNVLVSAVYTINNQLLIDIKPQIYFGKGNYFLDGAFKYQVFPNSFWGIGNTTPSSAEESYNMRSTELRVSMLKRLPPTLNFGLEYVIEFHDVTETEEGGQLEDGTIAGYDRAVVSGFGAIFNLDTRDNIGSPLNGHFLQMGARFSSELFGATLGYNKFVFDLRTYQKLGKKGVLAVQVYNESTLGKVPFQDMAWFGGGERGRGYFRGRFIDSHQYVVQTEYRYRFKPRWIVAAFALVGEVAPKVGEFFSDLKPSAGGGIRFKIVKDQDTWLRLDIGFGKDQSSGVYFGVNEAF